MTNFKVGQKVVLVDGSGALPECMSPKEGEVVTCAGYSDVHPEGIYLVEYPYGKYGQRQSHHHKHFRPLQYSSSSAEILAKFPITEEKADVVLIPEIV